MEKSTLELVKQALQQETKIGQILLAQTSLTQEQLREALQHQKDKGGRLGEILVHKKYLQPHEILIALGIHGALEKCLESASSGQATDSAIGDDRLRTSVQSYRPVQAADFAGERRRARH